MGRRLAASIQHALVRRLGMPDGGLHPRSIAILRETRMPAARVEPAVVLDALDASRIAGAAFAGDVARAIADGITAFSRPAPADLARST